MALQIETTEESEAIGQVKKIIIPRELRTLLYYIFLFLFFYFSYFLFLVD